MIVKATGVAAGVWNRLAKFGVSPKTVATAIPMRNFIFFDDGELVANVPVPAIEGHPPAQLYPQGELEQQLENALSANGIRVDYGTEFISCEERQNSIHVSVRNGSGELESMRPFDWVIGADGGRSAVRTTAKIPFVGRNYPEKWSVAEVATSQWPSNAQAQFFLQSSGVGLFLSQPTIGVVQGILNAENVFAKLQSHFPDAELCYERHFSVALKRAPPPRKGRIWLIGDAAHVCNLQSAAKA